MANFTFRPATRSGVGLLIGLASGTGGGKTMSAMRLATGIVGRDKRFAVIDTESGRARHYAPAPGKQPNFVDSFNFDVADLRAPFTPEAYTEAIMAADAAGYGAIVVDSASHVWAGDGGCMDIHDEAVEEAVRNAKKLAISKGWTFDEEKTRNANNIAAWIDPKTRHKSMVQKLLQVRSHLILCLRAEEKIEIVKEGGKTVIRPKQSMVGRDGWIPICEKSLPFELTVSFLMTASAPGVPQPIKLQEQHKALFPLDKPLGEESGRLIAEWANGAAAEPVATPAAQKPKPPSLPAALGAFAELGVTPEALTLHLGHPPTESDVPALKIYIGQLRLEKAAKSNEGESQ
jgi:hypothetical protein